MNIKAGEILSYILIGVFALIGLAVLIKGILLLIKLIKYLKVAKDKHPLTFDEELVRNRMPTGYYVICGRQRAGKGSLGCAIMDIDCTYHCEERLALAQAEVNELNNIEQDEPYDLHLPDFPYRSKTPLYLGPDNKKTYHTDIKDFKLPETAEDQHFPPYTMLHGEEVDTYLNLRTWADGAKNKANVIDAIKYIGHNEITYIADAQVFKRIDAGIRAITTDIFYVLKRKDYTKGDIPRKWYEFGHKHDAEIVKTEWTFLWKANQMEAEANELKSFGEIIPITDYVKKCTFTYYGNIYEKYNSKSGKAYWLKNIKDYYVEEHPNETLSRDAVEDYCTRNARRAENATEESENTP